VDNERIIFGRYDGTGEEGKVAGPVLFHTQGLLKLSGSDILKQSTFPSLLFIPSHYSYSTIRKVFKKKMRKKE